MLGLIFQAFMAVLLLVVVIGLLRMMATAFLKLLLALGLAFIAGLLSGVAAHFLGYDGPATGLLAAFLCLPLTTYLVWRRFEPFGELGAPRRQARMVGTAAPAAAAEPVETRLGVTDADALINAWDAAERLAPRAGLGSTRTACARFLVAHEANSHPDPDAMELALLIRRHVPGLLEDVEGVLYEADREERDRTIEEMVADLRLIGDNAGLKLVARSEAKRDRLRIRRARIAMGRLIGKDAE